MGCRPRVPKYSVCQKRQSVIHGSQDGMLLLWETSELISSTSSALYVR